jgi:hypothetical protein
MPEAAKMSVIGGGSPFVLALLHGLGGRAGLWRDSGGQALLSLYDIAPERA